MESLQEIFIVLGRIVTIIPLLLFMTIFMGKRAIGEIPIFDFLIVVILGAVVGADIADPDIHHLPTALAIIFIAILQKVVAKLKITNRFIGRLLTFEPTVVVQDGKILNRNLKHIRYSLDNLLQMLREKDVFNVNEVETAIVEANGSLSLLKKVDSQPVTRQDMNIMKATSTMAVPVVIEGKIDVNVLKDFSLDEDWLNVQLFEHGIDDPKDIFFASMNADLELQISQYKEPEPSLKIPRIRH
nr:DUF421 domain-containing protein [Salipaludibacillus keqinensis]